MYPASYPDDTWVTRWVKRSLKKKRGREFNPFLCPPPAELIYPTPMDTGMTFTLREGGPSQPQHPFLRVPLCPVRPTTTAELPELLGLDPQQLSGAENDVVLRSRIRNFTPNSQLCVHFG